MKANQTPRRTHPLGSRGDDAVSPVVGTILVLFIIILAMAGILAWGVPAVRGIQDHADFQSILAQMREVNGDLRALRDPLNTRQSAVSMTQGTLSVHEGSRWAITIALHDSYRPLNLSRWELESTTTLDLSLSPWPGATLTVTADRAQGGTFTRLGQATCASSPCSITIPSTYHVAENSTRVQYRDGSTLRAETWVFDVGRISYTAGNNQIHAEMGAVISSQNGRSFLQDRAAIKLPDFDTSPKDVGFVIRVFEFRGEDSVAGQGRHSVVASLTENYGSSRGRPQFAAAKSVRIVVDDSDHTAVGRTGLLEEAFCNYFKSLDDFASHGAPSATGDRCRGGDANVLYDPDPDAAANNNGVLSFDLSEAEVRVALRAT